MVNRYAIPPEKDVEEKTRELDSQTRKRQLLWGAITNDIEASFRALVVVLGGEIPVLNVSRTEMDVLRTSLKISLMT